LPRDARVFLNKGFSPAVTEWLLAAKEGGAFGLDLFFALSSYLITTLLLREYANRGSFSVRAFYVRRALRIWPLYFTFLALTVFVIPLIIPAERFGLIYIVSFALFVGNWACAVKGIPFSVAGPLWSISVEEQFYIAWPLLLRFFGIRGIKQLAVVMLLVAIGTRVLWPSLAWNIPEFGVTRSRVSIRSLWAPFSLSGSTGELLRSRTRCASSCAWWHSRAGGWQLHFSSTMGQRAS
jgi:peptidoglycan/LPS O-acetylase OafA/YrhL